MNFDKLMAIIEERIGRVKVPVKGTRFNPIRFSGHMLCNDKMLFVSVTLRGNSHDRRKLKRRILRRLNEE